MLDFSIGRIDDPVAVEIVVRVQVMKFQSRGLIGIELQSRRLELDQEPVRIDHGERDQDRVAGLKRRPIRFPKEAVSGDFEAQKILPRVGGLVCNANLSALAHLGPNARDR